jgi:CHASE2 domain-containing sensor protein
MKTSNNNSFKKDAFLCTLFTFAVSLLFYFLFVNISVLDPFEKAFKDFKFTDIFYAERFKNEERNDKIIIVNIKQADRFQLAQAIDKIANQNPKAIGLDIIFKDKKLAFTDSIVHSVLLRHNNIVTSYYHDKYSLVKNNSYFKSKNAEGYINLNLENQNTVIRDFLGVRDLKKQEFSFAAQLALTAGYIDKDYIIEELNHPIPINYIGNKDVFLNFDIDEIISLENIPAIKDAIVVMGYLGNGNTQFDIEDKHFTPLNKAWVGRAVPDTFGVTIHANILNMLIKQQLIYRLPTVFTYMLAFGLTFLMILFGMKLYKRNSFVFDLSEKIIQLLLSLLLLYIALLLLQFNLHINVVPLILLPIFGIEMIDFYEHLVRYLNEKFKWKSQLL